MRSLEDHLSLPLCGVPRNARAFDDPTANPRWTGNHSLEEAAWSELLYLRCAGLCPWGSASMTDSQPLAQFASHHCFASQAARYRVSVEQAAEGMVTDMTLTCFFEAGIFPNESKATMKTMSIKASCLCIHSRNLLQTTPSTPDTGLQAGCRHHDA